MSATLVRLAAASELPADDGWLSPAERAALGRFRAAARQRDFRVGRLAARRALALLCGDDRPAAARGFEVRPSPGGAPQAFRHGVALDVTLSIGHSAGRAAAAVRSGNVALGCDLETVEERSRAFVLDYFTPAEQAFADAGPADGRRATLVWSAKEAVMKALGEGLRLAPKTVEVRPDVHRVSAGGWRRFALAAPGAGPTLRGFWRDKGELVLTVAAEDEPLLVESTSDSVLGARLEPPAAGTGA